MSLGEAEAKFPYSRWQGSPPSPSVENPGQVFPRSDPKAASPSTSPGSGLNNDRGRQIAQLLAVGNPFLLNDVLSTVDRALTDAIEAIEGDGGRVAHRYARAPVDVDGDGIGSRSPETLLAKFERWRDEIDDIRGTMTSRSRSREEEEGEGRREEGGLFAD